MKLVAPVEKRYPDLVGRFRKEEVERLKQKDKEKQRRQRFLLYKPFYSRPMVMTRHRIGSVSLRPSKIRGDCFQQKSQTDNVGNRYKDQGRHSHDVSQLLRFVKKSVVLSSPSKDSSEVEATQPGH
jgi:hypothetical protein